MLIQGVESRFPTTTFNIGYLILELVLFGESSQPSELLLLLAGSFWHWLKLVSLQRCGVSSLAFQPSSPWPHFSFSQHIPFIKRFSVLLAHYQICKINAYKNLSKNFMQRKPAPLHFQKGKAGELGITCKVEMYLYSSHFRFNFCSLTTFPSFNLHLFLFESEEYNLHYMTR